MDEKFTEVLRPHLPFLPEGTSLSREDKLDELGLNSMQAVEVLFAVEDEFGAVIGDDELNEETFATAGSLWDVVSAARDGSVPEGASS